MEDKLLFQQQAEQLRYQLIKKIAKQQSISPAVLKAMMLVPRHALIPEVALEKAYGDHPVPIGFEQTISQPTIVAMMTEALELNGQEKVLEIGTGSGYQTLVLSCLARHVYTIEYVKPLFDRTVSHLSQLGCFNVTIKNGNGYKGWLDKSPFDRVIVTAAPPEIPGALIEQLSEGGIIVLPVGEQYEVQDLLKGIKVGGQMKWRNLGPVRFVPMVK